MDSVCIKCQTLFSGKIQKNASECRLLKFVPCIQSEIYNKLFIILFTVFTLNIWIDRPEQTVDPYQMPWNEASDLGLHCLPVIQEL